MTLDLNTNIDNALAGYRLHGLEVLNWGTFDGAVWTITPGGRNSLLTGDVGSGKSTLVDALTTLLVPARSITYNKAAGAAARERSLLTYLLGAYKNEKVASSARARDVYLRERGKTYSVLLANFRNAGTGNDVALAQVLYLNSGGAVSRLYLVGQRPLSIREDLSDFGNDVGRLKRRLRADGKVTLHNTFTQYAADFRRRFGLHKPEALDLFYQTVSMKQVGNLTEFVRERMLGRTDIQQQIDQLVKSYANVSGAHAAVLKARKQLEVLEPLVGAAREREVVERRLEELQEVRREIPRYFAHAEFRRQKGALTQVQGEWEVNEQARTAGERTSQDLNAKLARLESRLRGHDAYQQLQELDHRIETTTAELQRRRARADDYASLLAQLGESAPPPATTAETFATQRTALNDLARTTATELTELRERNNELVFTRTETQRELEEVRHDLDSLRQRPTNIPRRSLDLRRRLLEELRKEGHSLEPADLPFAGELLRVREAASDWEGAIERVLHGLGLSLLVHDDHYPALSRLVDRLDLGGRLVYLRTLKHRGARGEDSAEDSLVHKVRIKGDTVFYEWLEAELRVRYDYACCATLEDFQRSTKGLTRRGQVKSGRQLHRKDDRFAVGDRRRYVLGWTNREKIAALEDDLRRLEERLATTLARLSSLGTRDRALRSRESTLHELERRFTDFGTQDFASTSRHLQDLTEERRRLQSASQEIADLEAEITTVRATRTAADQKLRDLTRNSGFLEARILSTAQRLYELLELLGATPPDLAVDSDRPDVPAITAAYGPLDPPPYAPSPVLTKLLQKLGPGATEAAARDRLDGHKGLVERATRQRGRHERTITGTMGEYRNAFPDDVRDLDGTLAALPEYLALHRNLSDDKLPSTEDDFRKLLKEEAIRGIIVFENRLKRHDVEIGEKIASINQHLRAIDYDARLGTYITITQEAVGNAEIAAFRRDLRRALTGTLGGDEGVYDETKFFQVQEILKRFQSDTLTDKQWTARVTDVRQWYEFGADERYRETDLSKEFYSDSAGKSGGQKEKLAYTILASAIAFQFGLQAGRSTDRSFRFVAIDEAFGKGSDESTRYGLELFKQLNLQLLIVTPLQKINVIEDYVAGVHYVDNPGGRNSRVRNIGISEYREERARVRSIMDEKDK